MYVVHFIAGGCDTPKLASAWMGVRVWDGKSLHPQEPQRIGADESPGMCGEMSAGGDERACGRGVESGVRGDREAQGDHVFGNWSGSGSRALPDPVGAGLQSDANCEDGEERDRAGGVCEGPGVEEQVVGRGVLGERVFL